MRLVFLETRFNKISWKKKLLKREFRCESINTSIIESVMFIMNVTWQCLCC